MTALHGTSMEHTSTVYMLGGFVLYVKMPEPTTPLTISDPRGGLVATKWGKVLVKLTFVSGENSLLGPKK